MSEADRLALETDMFNEVATKSNFFFSIDENKVNKNLRIFDVTAPGNKYRHP